MNRSVRSVATILGLGFAVYFVARGAWWTVQPTAPLYVVLAIALYLAVMLIVTLWGINERLRLPLPAGIAALATAAVVPALISLSLQPDQRTEPFATWYIGAVGILAAACIVRRRFVLGWATLGILIVSACLWLGVGNAFTLGLIGSITWTSIAQVLAVFWESAVRDTEKMLDVQRAVSAWDASQEARQRERRVRVQRALALAGPMLSRVIATGGALSEEERAQTWAAEARLRDELRGTGLLDDAVRAVISDARERGITVTVLDEGGLDGIADARQNEIRAELARVISESHSERLIVRARRDERTAVTVVGRAGGSEDEDDVDLWHEIPR